MRAKVVEVRQRTFGHTSVLLDNGETYLLLRGEAIPEVGDEFPPQEVGNAVDEETSQVPVEQQQSAQAGTERQDEVGAARESGSGPQAEGQQGAEEIEA